MERKEEGGRYIFCDVKCIRGSISVWILTQISLTPFHSYHLIKATRISLCSNVAITI